VLVDDKRRILDAVSGQWGESVTTVRARATMHWIPSRSSSIPVQCGRSRRLGELRTRTSGGEGVALRPWSSSTVLERTSRNRRYDRQEAFLRAAADHWRQPAANQCTWAGR